MSLKVATETSDNLTLRHGGERPDDVRLIRTISNQKTLRILRLVAGMILLVSILSLFVPLKPLMPIHGLDPSWMFDMNQAVAQHLVFGRDIVLTFGPYASIYTELYHPATDRTMICGSLLLGLAYILVLLLLGMDEKPYLVVLYGLLLPAFITSRDALFFSYPLILGLLAYRATLLPDGHRTKFPLSGATIACFAILFAPLGFFPLIKVSLLPLSAVTIALCTVLLWHRGTKTLACVAAASPAISCVVLWALAGQPLLALPRFVLTTEQMIAGYTEAMGFAGDPWECILYIFASALILSVVIRRLRAPLSSRLVLAALYAFFLFTAFKAGFVRHDAWHNVTAASSIFIAAYSLLFVADQTRSLAPIAMSVLAWAYIGHGQVQKAPVSAALNFKATFARTVAGAEQRMTPGELQREYDQSLAAIRAEFPMDKMQGTSDIYSVNQSWIFASGNTWAPRPIVQSYEAYTTELARLNLLHLESAGAPDNIVFRVEPIDSRLPALEDGLSWPAIINKYSLVRLDAKSAYLRKRPAEQITSDTSPTGSSLAIHKFAEEVPLPDTEEPLVARLEIRPTVFGRVWAALYKPPQLYITARLRDGSTMRYRTISEMMKSEFVMTPLVRNTEDFTLLAAGGMRYLANNEVKSFSISSDDSAGIFWSPVYSLNLRKVKLELNTETENANLFDARSATTPESKSPPSILRCEGSIESVNANLPSSHETIVRGALYVNGWMGVAPRDGIVADSVFVTLKNDSGAITYVRTHRTRRADIKNHFNHPEMPEPGYTAMIDVSDWKGGQYTLGLARTYQGQLSLCQQFNYPLHINP